MNPQSPSDDEIVCGISTLLILIFNSLFKDFLKHLVSIDDV